MENETDQHNIKAGSLSLSSFVRTGAASPLIYILIIVTLVCSLGFWLVPDLSTVFIAVWIIILILIVAPVLWAFVFDPDRLRGEGYNLKKMELLGDKTIGLIKDVSSIEYAQPIEQLTSTSVNTKKIK